MAVVWTDISDGEVAIGAPLSTALLTSLRDRTEGMAQRASGAIKMFGVPYNYQEFTTSGTWTRPSNIEDGDRIVVYCVGGGTCGQRAATSARGGYGGSGVLVSWTGADMVNATEPTVVGAGVAGSTGSSSTDGGLSSFGTAGAATAGVMAIYCDTGTTPEAGTSGLGGHIGRSGSVGFNDGNNISNGGSGGVAEGTSSGGDPSVLGAGGGGAPNGSAASGGVSLMAGHGGEGTGLASAIADFGIDGQFPGGGGAGVDTGSSGDTVSGAGADGVVRVWCIRDGD